VRLSQIATEFWRDFDEKSLADYMRVCMPLYNPPGSAEGGLAGSG